VTVVRTLLDDVPPSEVGAVDAHTHLFARGTPAVVARDPDLLLDEPDRMAAELDRFRTAGGGTIVEMTTVDYGRDLDALRGLSSGSGVPIVAVTGFNKGIYCRPWCAGRSPASVSATQIADVELRRCGAVKLGTSRDAIEPWEKVALEAAALTHLATGCPVVTHTEAGTYAEEQLDQLEAAGVDPASIVLGHLDRRPDPELHLRLADRGAHLSYDQLPKPSYGTEPGAIELLIALARRGLHTQVVAGSDLARRSYFPGYGGAPGLAYLLSRFRRHLVDRVDEAGLPGEAVARAVLVENPARAFAMRA
jgi:predicted metal-dependent phosphotriesterase family hydrolase